MEVIHAEFDRKKLEKTGFLDISVDPSLDLLNEIEQLKKKKNKLKCNLIMTKIIS